VGLIAKLFPGAPVLHTTRDVRDTLLSNYQMAYQQVNRSQERVDQTVFSLHLVNVSRVLACWKCVSCELTPSFLACSGSTLDVDARATAGVTT